MKIIVSSIGGGPLAERGFSAWHAVCLFVLLLSVYFLFPSYLSLAGHVVVLAIFALSIDIAMGIAGIVTLGHAVFFGVGAYAAGFLSLAGWHEPVSAVLLSSLCAALLALLTGPLILRLTGLPLVMGTLTICVCFFEIANKLGSYTGGDDGLSGVEFAPIFGVFDWSIFGTTEYIYALTWLVLVFWAAQRLVASPFGMALRGVRENHLRMRLLGAPVTRHLVTAYAISAFVAGLAGALLTQITKFVGLEVLSVETSIDGVVMVVLGGVGHLYGALLGTPLYLLVKDLSKQWNPHAWMIVIGFLLIGVILLARGGLYGLCYRLFQRLRGRAA